MRWRTTLQSNVETTSLFFRNTKDKRLFAEEDKNASNAFDFGDIFETKFVANEDTFWDSGRGFSHFCSFFFCRNIFQKNI